MQSVIFSALFGTGYAGMAQMEAKFQQMKSNSTDRALTDMMGASLQNFQQYGCWCYFDDLHGKGKSHATDDIDALCQILAEGYDCAVIDAEEAGGSCVPWEVDYSSGSNNLDFIVEDCENRNADTCAMRACIIENWFVTNIFQMFLSGGQIDANKKHIEVGGPFSVEQECPTKPCPEGPGQCFGDKSCCGSYPTRRVFKTHGGQRACCGSKTYDSDVMQCCADDRVKLVC